MRASSARPRRGSGGAGRSDRAGRGVIASVALACAALLGCSTDRSPPRDVQAVPATTSTAVGAATAPAAPIGNGKGASTVSPRESIGTATMENDGTIVLQLRAEGPGRLVGDARVTYPKSHKEYDNILKHLGGLRPGESKPVPPFPE